MFGNFSIECQKILVDAKIEMDLLKHPYVGSEHLILAILKDNNGVTSILNENGIYYDNFRDKLIETVGIGSTVSQYTLYTPLLKRVIECAIIESNELKEESVAIKHLFSALLDEGDGVGIRILLSLSVDLEELYDAFEVTDFKATKTTTSKLGEYGINMNDKAIKNEIDQVIGRDKEINRIIEILCRRSKNNPILVGKPGVGKTAIVEGLVHKIINEEVPTKLLNKTIYNIEMASLVAGTKYRGEFEEKLRKIINEIESDDSIIIFIDEVHTLVKAGGAEGAIDASNILKPALARGKIRLIGATTEEEYKKFIENDGALDRRFQKINISIPSGEEVVDILTNIKGIYEDYHKVKIEDSLLVDIVELASKYIFDRNEPDRSIDILDEACSRVSIKASETNNEIKDITSKINYYRRKKDENALKGEYEEAIKFSENIKQLENKLDNINKEEKTLTVELNDVKEIINMKSGSFYERDEVNNKIKKVIDKINLSLTLNKDVIKKLDKSMKKILLNLGDDKLPYSLLLMGPNGTGKTTLSNILAEELTLEESIIKLNMNDFIDESSKSKLVGSSAGYIGYDDKNYIFDKVKRNPKSLFIIENYEKAIGSVQSIFKSILETGEYKDSRGNVINFRLCIFIFTSNIVTDNSIGFSNKSTKTKSLIDEETLSLIEDIIEIPKLTKYDLELVVDRKLKEVKQRYKFSNINLKFNTEVSKELVDLSEFEKMGARSINKLVKSNVENKVIEGIISNKKNIVVDTVK